MTTANDWYEYTDEEMEHPLAVLKKLFTPKREDKDSDGTERDRES